MKSGLPRCELDENRHGAVCLRPRRGEEAIGDLSLHHHAPALERRGMFEGLHHERRGDVVGQIRDELGRARPKLSRVEPQRVTPDQIDVRPSLERVDQRGLERPVELDSVDELHPVGDVTREHAESRPDLEHDVGGREIAHPLDHAEDVLVDEEMLAQRLLGLDGHARPNALAAFACIRAASSVSSSPRVSASLRIV